MSLWTFLDFLGSLVALVILVVVWWIHFRNPPDRRTWRCFRYQGGGVLVSPRPMTLEEVTVWLGKSNHAEIAYVDRDMSFIFYRPMGH